MVSSAPPAAPTQKDPLMATSTRPRYLAGDQLVDGGVDGGVLAADAGAGDEPGREVPQRVVAKAVATVSTR